MSEDSDRRRKVRVPLQSRIRHSLYHGMAEPVFVENSSVDLSSNGISFLTTREYAKGNLIVLDVYLGEEPLKLLVCAARVERDGDGYRIGAELVAIDPLQKKKMNLHLESLVDRFLSRPSPKPIRTKKKPRKKAPGKMPPARHRTTLSKKKKKKSGR